MKSDHRHELKTNDLAQWVAEFPDWARENMRTIIASAAIVVAVILVYTWYLYDRNVLAVSRRVRLSELTARLDGNKRQVVRSGMESKDQSVVLLQSADQLAQFAQSTGDRTMAALACIKRAEAIRAEIHYRADRVSGEELAKRIELSKACYQEALDKAPSQASLRAAARYGLGLCAEELSDQVEARRIYRQIAADSGLKGTVAQVQANRRLQSMADYAGAIVFKPAPAPVPAPTFVTPDSNATPALGPVSTSATETNTAEANSAAK